MGLLRFFAHFVGWVMCLFTILSAIIVGALLGYAQLDLPEGIEDYLDKTSIVSDLDGSIDGFLTPEVDLTLISAASAEREGRRVAVLADDFAYINSAFVEDRISDTNLLVPSNIETPVEIIRVSRFFETDFASVPFPANRLINPFGRHAEAAIIHDWLYAIGEENGRKSADLIFYSAMKHSGVNWLRRRLMYASVRLGGGKSYGQDTEWFGRFYDPDLGIQLPQECIIDRTRAGEPMYSSVELLQQESFGTEITNPFYERWRKTYTSKPCLDFLLDRATSYAQVGGVRFGEFAEIRTVVDNDDTVASEAELLAELILLRSRLNSGLLERENLAADAVRVYAANRCAALPSLAPGADDAGFIRNAVDVFCADLK